MWRGLPGASGTEGLHNSGPLLPDISELSPVPAGSGAYIGSNVSSTAGRNVSQLHLNNIRRRRHDLTFKQKIPRQKGAG